VVLHTATEPAVSGNEPGAELLVHEGTFPADDRGLRICLFTSVEEGIFRARSMEKGCRQPIT